MSKVCKCRNSLRQNITLPPEFLNEPNSELRLSFCLRKLDCAPHDNVAIQFENVNAAAQHLSQNYCLLLHHLNNLTSGQLESETTGDDIFLLQNDTDSAPSEDLSVVQVKLVRTASPLWQSLVLPKFSGGSTFAKPLVLRLELWLKRCECAIALDAN